jgi:hypothetical protein
MSNRSPDATALVGRAIVVSVGEPWDFRSTAGDNLLTGRVVEASAPNESAEWLLCEVSPFTIDSRTVSTVAVVRRYAGEEPWRQLQAGGTTYANVLYDPTGAALTPGRLRSILAASAAPATNAMFLVGSVRVS